MRLIEGGAVISEVLRHPGATHSVFDVLAAAVRVLAPGPRVALLGFAAGGVVAPLRALGHRGRLEGVDLSRAGWSVFRRLCGRWAGPVVLHRAEAGQWLRRRRGRFDAIVEDLSVRGRAGTTKPQATVDDLPGLLAARLGPGGVAIVNLLPVPGWPRSKLEAAAGRAYRDVLVVQLESFENRILIGARGGLPASRDVARELRRTLRSIDSALAHGLSVRGGRKNGRNPSSGGYHGEIRGPASGLGE